MQKETSENAVIEKIIAQHISSFMDNNMVALLSDYTKDSVLMTKDATYKGIEEIKTFFSTLFPHFPKQSTNMELEIMTVSEGVVFIVWHAKTPSVEVPFATDTFVVKEGKIYRQTFAGTLNYK